MPVIATNELTMQFGEHRALDALTLEVGHGVTGLVGANGAGKTTLISILLGLQFPTAGSARVLDLDPRADGARLRATIGYAPERNVLPDDMKAVDFVRHLAEVKGLPRDEARTRASDSLWLVGLGEERFRPLGTMSTGQRQRVKLAMAIAGAPKLILLDEPTDGLDPMQRESMLTLIKTVSREFEIDVMLSSHLLEEVERVCDHVIAVDAGRLIAAGAVGTLLAGEARLRFEAAAIAAPESVVRVIDALRGRGLNVVVDGALVTVTGAGHDELADVSRDLLAAHDVPIRSFGALRRRLEDVFADGGA